MAEPKDIQHIPIPTRGVNYRGKVVLAPMVRSGELPCRLTALKYGADLVWGPETIDKALIGCTRRFCDRTKTIVFSRFPSNGVKVTDTEDAEEIPGKESVIYRIHPELESKKLVYQIGTANPELAVKAASMVAPDVAGIDVNAGCPKPFSTSGGMGAALLRTPNLLCDILRALVEKVGKPNDIGISVKIRLLETEEQTIALVRRLCATGITGLTVHCRTTPMRPRERAIRGQLKAVVRTCHEAGVSCTMNGDVESREQAFELMKEYGADGAMIATAAEKNPSVFRAAENGGRAPWREIVRTYLEYAMSVDNRWGNTKFTLAQIAAGKEKGLDVSRYRNHEQVVDAFEFDDLLQRAKDLDLRLNLINPESWKARKRAAAQDKAAAKKARKEAENEMAEARSLQKQQEEADETEPSVVTGSGQTGTAITA